MSGPAKRVTKQNAASSTIEDNPAQSKRFIDAAREAGADETEEGADRAFKRVSSPRKNQATPKGPKHP
jgi:hypothetical protein